MAGARILDQMQYTGEQRMRLSGSADMDDAGPFQFFGEDVDDQFQYVIVEGTESAVDEHPGRRLQ